MSLPSTGISMGMVASEIGHYTQSLATLCTSSNINKWSKWKPIYENSTTLTDSILRLDDYGFKLSSGTTNYELANQNFTEMMNVAKNGCQWYYRKPAGGQSSPYRLGDFRNYNHSAVAYWDGVGIPTAVTTPNNSVGIYVNVYEDTADILASDLSYLNGDDKMQWHYALMYRQKNSSETFTIVTGTTVWEDATTLNNDASVVLTYTGTTEKTFECCMIATKMTDIESPYIAYLIPDSYREITFNPNLTPFSVYLEDSVVDLTPAPSQSSPNANTMDFDLYFYDVTNVTNYTFTFNIYDEDVVIATRVITGNTLTEGTISVNLSGSTFYTGYLPEEEYDPEFDHYYFNATLQYTYNSTQYTRYFNLDNLTKNSSPKSTVDVANDYYFEQE